MNGTSPGSNGQATSPKINGNGKAASDRHDALPPHNLEAEQLLLSGVMLDNDKFPEVLENVSADEFYRSAHQIIFGAMERIYRRGEPVDAASLAEELGDQLRLIGGDDYLADLHHAPHGENCVYHAQLIRLKYASRKLIESNNESNRECYSNLITPDESVERTIRRLETIKKLVRPPVSRQRSDFATLADVRREASGDGWIWRGWIPSARLWGIAAFEGVGKTRFSMDLARRWWFGREMPDGQSATIPQNTPTLWVCADGQQDDLLEIAAAYGLPDEAVFLNTVPTDPYGGSSLDDLESIERLEAGILAIKPACVFVDTLTNATSRDLCRANEAKLICSPLNEIAKRTKTAVCLDCHVALNGKALGKRVRGWTRTMISVECPDPNHPERLKIYPEKTFAKRPEALGATMSDAGTEYDQNPPVAPDIPKGGKWGAPPKAREQAVDLIRESLTLENDQTGNKLQESLTGQGIAKTTFWRAVREMEANGELIIDGGARTGRQAVLHLIRTDPAF